MREYTLNGKSIKYERLKAEFEKKFKKAGEAFLRKNVDSLKETNQAQAYNILKRMGAKPGDLDENCTFTLPSHTHGAISSELYRLKKKVVFLSFAFIQL